MSRLLRCLTALATLGLAAFLCWQCMDIYFTGNRPGNLDESGVHIAQVYTAQEVGARLAPLALPVIGYAALICVTAAADARAPKKPEPPAMTQANRLRLLKRRAGTLPEGAVREERLRRHTRIAALAVLLLCAVACLAYLLDGSNFTSWELESVMGQMLLHVLPWVALGFAAAYAAAWRCDRSMARECALLQGLKGGADLPAPERALPANALRIGLYGVAIVFIVLGVMNGGLYDVLVKAIHICTECIGLG